MPPAARLTDLHTCPMVTPGVPPIPHVGGPIMPPCVPTVLIDFLPAANVTTMAMCVGPPDIIVKGSAGVFINFLPAARIGDTTAHGGVIVMGSPTCIIGEVGAPSPGAGGLGGVVAGLVVAGLARTQIALASALSKPGGSSDAGDGEGASGGPAVSMPASLPKDCPSAPKTIKIPKDVNDTFNKLMKNSFPGGKSQEQGGLIAADAKGAISVINQVGGNSGSFLPDRTLPAGSNAVGLFHTHPYDASEGGYTGVSFSGADIAVAANNSEPSYVQSGETQFLMLPTSKTPKNLDYKALSKSQNDRIAELTGKGVSFDQASRTAANETAQKYGCAYYEGKDGELNRVSC